MKVGRAMSAMKSTGHRRTAMFSSMIAVALLLAIAFLPASTNRDVIASIRAAWIHIAARAMQFPAGRPGQRAVKIWIGAVAAGCIVRLNSRFVQSL